MSKIPSPMDNLDDAVLSKAFTMDEPNSEGEPSEAVAVEVEAPEDTLPEGDDVVEGEEERTPPDGEAAVADLTDTEWDLIDQANLSPKRSLEIVAMEPAQRQAVLEFIRDEVARRAEVPAQNQTGTSVDKNSASEPFEVTAELIEKVSPALPDDVIEDFAAKLGVEAKEVEKFAVAIRNGAVEPLIRMTNTLAQLYQAQQSYMNLTLFSVGARNARVKVATDIPEALDDGKFMAVAKDPVTIQTAEAYLNSGLDPVEAAEKAVIERFKAKYGRGTRPLATTARVAPKKAPQPRRQGTAEVAGGVKKVFEGQKPTGEMTLDEALDAAWEKFQTLDK